MAFYEFRTISHGRTIWTVEHCCHDDVDALDQAEKSCENHQVQVWQNDKRVARVKGENEPLNARGSLAEHLRHRIELYRSYLEGGSFPQQTELYMRRLFEAEDDLEELKRNKDKLH